MATGTCGPCGDSNPMSGSCTKSVSPVSGFEQLKMKLRDVIPEDSNKDIDEKLVRRLLEGYTSQPADWEKYAHHNPDFYTRNLVCRGNGRYNLLLLCWPPNKGSSIHSHSDSHCWVKVLQGTLKETLYDWPDAGSCDTTAMTVKEQPQRYTANGVTYINDDMALHKMENPSCCEPTVSLHLYVPPFDTCKVFHPDTSQEDTANVTFYSEYGNVTQANMKVNKLGTAEGK